MHALAVVTKHPARSLFFFLESQKNLSPLESTEEIAWSVITREMQAVFTFLRMHLVFYRVTHDRV